MKTIFHCGYDGKPVEEWYVECFFDNLAALVIRTGGEPFKSCYDIEWSYCSRLQIPFPYPVGVSVL